jgi:hypothetical protein
MLVLATMEKLAGTVPTLQFFCYPAKDLQVKVLFDKPPASIVK